MTDQEHLSDCGLNRGGNICRSSCACRCHTPTDQRTQDDRRDAARELRDFGRDTDAGATFQIFVRDDTPTDNEKLIEDARNIVRSWDLKGSWNPDSPIGMLGLLADALEAAEKAHAPSGNEKLIEEAATAVRADLKRQYEARDDGPFTASEDGIEDLLIDGRVNLIEATCAALAVFEKARTPTHDERWLLATSIWSELKDSDISMNSVFLDRLTSTLVTVIFDAGFRHSEELEKNDEAARHLRIERCFWCSRASAGAAVWRADGDRYSSCGKEGHGEFFSPSEPQAGPPAEAPEPSDEVEFELRSTPRPCRLPLSAPPCIGCRCEHHLQPAKPTSDLQGEPSNVTVQKALDAALAYYRSVLGEDVESSPEDFEAMRAALRAAGAVR